MKRFAVVFVAFLLLLAGLTACGGGKGGTAAPNTGQTSGDTGQAADNTGQTQTPSNTGQPTAVDAAAVFKANCVQCHGAQLQGGVGPPLQKVGSQLTQDQIHHQIENGGGGMPPFKQLGDDKINALAAWLASKK